MAIRWSRLALVDLDRIWHFNTGPDGARIDRADAIQRRIQHAPLRLHALPFAGRPGVVPGTRELLLRDLQYVVVYVVEDDGVRIVRVLSTRERA
jgi:toxin ParE1/3/4